MNKFIDHTFLKPDANSNDIKKLCDESIKYNFYSVCVAPFWVNFVNGLILKNSDIKICSVIGFPHGNITNYGKYSEIQNLQKSFRIDEFDVVLNLGSVKSSFWAMVDQEVSYIRNSTNKTIKYIIEIGYLTDNEIERVCEILINNKIDYVKTCTGYGPRNVTENDIRKLKQICGNKIKIKASGGIKTTEQANILIDCGASRLGSSSSVEIIEGKSANLNPY